MTTYLTGNYICMMLLFDKLKENETLINIMSVFNMTSICSQKKMSLSASWVAGDTT